MLATLLSFIIFAVIGFLSALIGILFIDGSLSLLKTNLQLYAQYWWLALIIPTLIGLLCAIILRLAQQSSFANLGEIILVAQRRTKNDWQKDILATIGSVLSIGGGFSVGQYGPIAHLGGSLGIAINKLQRWVNIPSHHSAACGVAAAIAAAFNAPITGIMFTHEVILRHYSIRIFTPVAVCAVVGYAVSTDLLDRPLMEMGVTPQIHIVAVIFFILLGLLLGVIAFIYINLIFLIAQKCRRYSLFWRLPCAGFLIGILLLIIPNISDNVSIIETVVTGFVDPNIVVGLLIAKIIATIICLGTGYAGGIVSPTLFIGGLFGALFFHIGIIFWDDFAQIVPLPTAILCGMVALTAPVIGAPLAGILLVMELSQSYQMAILATICVAISVRIQAKLGGISYYDRQVMTSGHDMQINRDEWLFQTQSIESFIQPVRCVVNNQTSVSDAIDHAIQNQSNKIYIIDSNSHYIGVLRLIDALTIKDKSTPLSPPLLPKIAKNSPTVDTSMSMQQALEIMRATQQHTLPVVNQGKLLGTIDESKLFSTYESILAEQRKEYR